MIHQNVTNEFTGSKNVTLKQLIFKLCLNFLPEDEAAVGFNGAHVFLW